MNARKRELILPLYPTNLPLERRVSINDLPDIAGVENFGSFRKGMTSSVVVSAHDFRSQRKASIHFIAADLALRGPTRFLSVGFSNLSRRRGDPRIGLENNVNRVEVHKGVECFLWKMAWHPFSLRSSRFSMLERLMFKAYRLMLPEVAAQWIAEADAVYIESGIAPAFLSDIRRLNPNARITYLASDDLNVVGCAPSISIAFQKHYDLIDVVRLPSRCLVSGLPHTRNAILVPHGIDKTLADVDRPNPYGPRPACISVGSMLFDRSFFEIASALYPRVDFHIIGGGRLASGLVAKNLILYPEMPFESTLPYLQHATLGAAAYVVGQNAEYLKDTSLKLKQFSLFGIPAVCPHLVCGENRGRFGYRPGDSVSIRSAIRAALGSKVSVLDESLSWSEVVDRILEPELYADTFL